MSASSCLISNDRPKQERSLRRYERKEIEIHSVFLRVVRPIAAIAISAWKIVKVNGIPVLDVRRVKLSCRCCIVKLCNGTVVVELIIG
jgi:hypothetical protein